MYNCQICGVTSQPRMPMLKHIVHRHVPGPIRAGKVSTRTEVACEVPVCGDCLCDLHAGFDLHAMIAENRREMERESQLLTISKYADRDGDDVCGYIGHHAKPRMVGKQRQRQSRDTEYGSRRVKEDSESHKYLGEGQPIKLPARYYGKDAKSDGTNNGLKDGENSEKT